MRSSAVDPQICNAIFGSLDKLKSGEPSVVQLSDLFLAELERETVGTRKVLERVPEGKNNWKPHPKSMQLGYLECWWQACPPGSR
jgi:hypothetical protein